MGGLCSDRRFRPAAQKSAEVAAFKGDAVRQLQCFGDQRNKGFCIHCGGADETDDHVPSKVLLDDPYPENLMVCSSCLKCNNALSLDEEYFACLLECVIAGDVDPTKVRRPRIARRLSENPSLMRRLQDGRADRDGRPYWNVENERVRAVVSKLGRCHAAFEYNEPRLGHPTYVDFRPLETMNETDRRAFEGSDELAAAWPEVGSRAMQRLLVVGTDVFSEGWLVVQESNYRFKVGQDDGLNVKIVLRDYLACHVAWE